MGRLFTEYFEYLLKFSFDFYDTNGDGIITPRDITLIFSYFPLRGKKFDFSFRFQFEDIDFVDQLVAQNEVHTLCTEMFKKETMKFDTYKTYITKVNPIPFLFLIFTLYEFQPFSNETIKHYSVGASLKTNFIKVDDTKGDKPNVIPIPSFESCFRCYNYLVKSDYFRSFLTPELIKQFDYDGSSTQNPRLPFSLQLMQSLEQQKKEDRKKKENNIDYSDSDSETVSYDNILDKFDFKSRHRKSVFDPNTKIYVEGKIYKLTKVKKIKLIYAELIHNDIYFYKMKNELTHKSKKNLNLAYFKDNGLVQVDENTQMYNFILKFPKKVISLYLDNEKDYKEWMKTIKILINYKEINEYEIKEKIGVGRYGLVRRAIHKITKRRVAIKCIEKKNMTHQESVLLKTEIEILTSIKHPNVLAIYDVIDGIDMCYIITEYIPGGDLYTYLEKKDYKISESKSANIIHQISCSIYYLNAYGIIHRDIKPEHILLNENYEDPTVKLIDFGLSGFIFPHELKNEPFGTIGYIPPEVLAGKVYDERCDVWCIGVTTYLLLVSCLPFDDDHSEQEIKRMILYEQVPFPMQLWKKKSQEGFFFVENALRKEYETRMSIKNVLELSWFNKFTKSKLPGKRSKCKSENVFLYYALNDDSQVVYYKDQMKKRAKDIPKDVK